VATDTSLRGWVNAYWDDVFEFEFEKWAQERIKAGASSKGISREISAMVRDKAGVNDGTLRNWFPALRDDAEKAA
jgi:hypothetical protein